MNPQPTDADRERAVDFLAGNTMGYHGADADKVLAQHFAEVRASAYAQGRADALAKVRSVAEFTMVEAEEIPHGAAYGRAGLESASAWNVAKVKAAAINEAADAAEVACTLTTSARAAQEGASE